MLLRIFLGMLKVGFFSFGGTYTAIELIMQGWLKDSWVSREELVYMIGISEITPGPVLPKLAASIGLAHGGIIDSFVAMFAIILPGILITLLLITLGEKLLKKETYKVAMKGIKPCVIGIIFATAIVMLIINTFYSTVYKIVDPLAIVYTVTLLLTALVHRIVYKKSISPLFIIAIGAGLGMSAIY